MDPVLYMLAMARLAPVQLMHAGHPLSSGVVPTVDYFVSHEVFEAPDPETAQAPSIRPLGLSYVLTEKMCTCPSTVQL